MLDRDSEDNRHRRDNRRQRDGGRNNHNFRNRHDNRRDEERPGAREDIISGAPKGAAQSQITPEQVQQLIAASQAQQESSDKEIAQLREDLNRTRGEKEDLTKKVDSLKPKAPAEELKKEDDVNLVAKAKTLPERYEEGLSSVEKVIDKATTYVGKAGRVVLGVVLSPVEVVRVGLRFIGSTLGGIWKGLSEQLFKAKPPKTA